MTLPTLTAAQRQMFYGFLGIVNTVLIACVQQNEFKDAPQVAHWVALASFVMAMVMKELSAKDAPKDPPPADPSQIGFKQ